MRLHGPTTNDQRLYLRLDRDQIGITGEGYATAQARQERRGIGGKGNLLYISATLRVQDMHLAVSSRDIESRPVRSERGSDRDRAPGHGNRGRRLVKDIEHQHGAPVIDNHIRGRAILRNDQLGGDKAALA